MGNVSRDNINQLRLTCAVSITNLVVESNPLTSEPTGRGMKSLTAMRPLRIIGSATSRTGKDSWSRISDFPNTRDVGIVGARRDTVAV